MHVDFRKHTTKQFLDTMSKLELRFRSGNSIEIESARITKEDFDIVDAEIQHMIMNMEIAALEKFNREIEDIEKES